jgi:predicted permease
LESLIRDLRYAGRSLRHSLPLAASIVLCLGFGIGASTTIFSWAEGLVLRPLPSVADPDRLVTIRAAMPGGTELVSRPEFLDWQAQAQSLTNAAAFSHFLFGVSAGDSPAGTRAVPTYGTFVSAGYFDVLEIPAAQGRMFAPADDETTGRAPVAVVSHRFWESRMDRTADLARQPLRINGRLVTVIGIAPPEFRGTFPGVSFDLWVPLTLRPELVPSDTASLDARDNRWIDVIARLRPAVTMAQAAEEFDAIAQRLAAAYPEHRGRGVSVMPLDTGSSARQMALLFTSLLALTFLVLLIVCFNITNLLLARGAARVQEIAIRVSLGATRARVFRQLMTENLLLAGGGALLGIAIVWWGRGLFARMLPTMSIPFDIRAPIDGRVLAFMIGVTAIVALIFGLVPAIALSQANPARLLAGSGRGNSAARSRVRAALVVAQYALCFTALVCAVLFMRRTEYLERLDRGFADPAHVLLIQTESSLSGYRDLGQWQQTLARITERSAQIPGVRAAGWATFVPLGFVGQVRREVAVEGYTARDNESMRLLVNGVDPGYFGLMGIPILQGRAIAQEDASERPRVAVVNEAFVRHFLGSAAPVGRRLALGRDTLTVVGVARDGKYDYRTIDAPPRPLVYYALQQAPAAFVTLHLRVDRDPATVVAAARAVIASVDPSIPILPPMSLEEYSSLPMFPARLGSALLSGLSLVALVLCAMGLYALIAYGVTLRTREIGIRLALGAAAGQAQRLFIREALVLTTLGLVAGIVCARVATAALQNQLPYLPQPDLASFAWPGAVLAVAGLAAGYIPARRSTRIEPAVTLRME